MPKPPGGLLLRKTRLRKKWRNAQCDKAGMPRRTRFDLRNQLHRKAWFGE